MKRTITGIILSIFLVFTACQKSDLNTQGDYFFLRNKGADMPVWVKGNKASRIFIIFLHGGPGNGSIINAISKSHKQLQQQYAMVYYDQRASGLAEGNADPSTYTLSQFVQDLDQIVTLINQKYDHPALFLMGASWGGALGTAYMISGQNRALIKGWIDQDGGQDWKRANKLGAQYVMDYAQTQIDSGYHVVFWQKAIKWYQTHTIDEKNLPVHVYLLQKAHGYYHDPKNDPVKNLPWNDLLFKSPLSLGGYFNFIHLENHMKFTNIDLAPQMSAITTPSLILWGRYDGIFPLPLAYEAYDSLGTPKQDKQLIIFDHSAHSLPDEEPEKFVRAVSEFVEKYK